MFIPQFKISIKFLGSFVAIIFVSGILCVTFAQDSEQNVGNFAAHRIPEKKKGTVISDGKTGQGDEALSELQRTAREYRSEGVEFQRAGNLEAALAFYQKAIELDPGYAVAYNDLGVIFESSGDLTRAEQNYLKAVKVDPNYLSAYSNLAIFSENKRDLKSAQTYWEKRVKLGSNDDPWTQKAKQRLADVSLVLSAHPLADTKEKEVVNLLNDISAQKDFMNKDRKALAKNNFERAKLYYQKGDGVTALKLAVDAQQLDSSDRDIEEFVDNLQTRLLTR